LLLKGLDLDLEFRGPAGIHSDDDNFAEVADQARGLLRHDMADGLMEFGIHHGRRGLEPVDPHG